MLLGEYILPECPRDLFAGEAFFLNSCDAEATVSTFVLEKIIRFLGGSTSMTATGVAYVVTQHLCSTKSVKAQSRVARTNLKYVHPQFVLDCAKRGRKLRPDDYATIVNDQPTVTVID